MPQPPTPNKTGIRSNRGVALIIALFAMVLMVFIANEVSHDARVEYVISAHAVNRVKAYYAAKSAIELSLLRVMVYKQAAVALGANQAALLEPIWQFPFMWPPVAGGKMTEVDKDSIQAASAESLMEAQYAVTIESEGGKLDINLLGSPVKASREAAVKYIMKIFDTEMQNNSEFQKKYSSVKFDELVNNIIDWIDEDAESLNGGEESRAYDKMEDSSKFPPNRAFRTIDELHMVVGMKDDFFRLLQSRITAFGTMGISVNYAPKEVLMSLDTTMTEEVVDELIRLRTDPQHGPFKTGDDFLQEAGRLGANSRAIGELKIPLLTGVEFNFRIKATGIASNIKREITVVTFDFDNLIPSLAKSLDDQDKGGAPPPPQTPPTPPGGQPADPAQPEEPKIVGPKGRPKVVYWEEN